MLLGVVFKHLQLSVNNRRQPAESVNHGRASWGSAGVADGRRQEGVMVVLLTHRCFASHPTLFVSRDVGWQWGGNVLDESS